MYKPTIRKGALLSSLGLALVGSIAVAATSGQDQPQAGKGTNQESSKSGGASQQLSLANHHSLLRAAINASNAKRLKIAWQYHSTAPVSHTPLQHGNHIYFADWDGNVYAVNAQNGHKIWQVDAGKPQKKWPWHAFAGTGIIGANKLFEASVEGEAYAFDLHSGKILWHTHLDKDKYAGNVGQLLFYNGLVYIGLSSVEEPLTQKEHVKPHFQGKVIALDARTGKRVWMTLLVKAPGTGVAVWSAFALDPASQTLYFTTGNNYSPPATGMSDSIVAVNARTGKVLWHQQTYKHDIWTKANKFGPDYDFVGGPQLFDATIGGKTRHLVGAAQKSGVYHVWDRRTGAPVWQSAVGYGGVEGGMHGAASIGRKYLYMWSNNAYDHKHKPQKRMMNIEAVGKSDGKRIWKINKAQPAALTSSGFLADNVYFVASLDGKIRGYNASSSKRVWTSPDVGTILTSVAGSRDSLYVGTGTPKLLKWAKGENGVTAFRLMP